MKIAHVRERHRAGRALRGGSRPRSTPPTSPTTWLDLEVARRRAAASDPRRAHNSVAPSPAARHARRSPRPRAAGRGAARARRRLRGEVEDDDAILDAADSRSGHRSCGRRRSATSTPSRVTSGRCGNAAAARFRRPGTGCRSSTSATSPRSAGRTIPSGARRRPSSSTTSWRWRRSSTRPSSNLAPTRAEEAIGGYTIFNDWSARDLQREETTVRLGPAKGKDFASSFGPYLVTPDELADARARRTATTWP